MNTEQNAFMETVEQDIVQSKFSLHFIFLYAPFKEPLYLLYKRGQLAQAF